MKAKLIPFTGPPREDRLLERAKIVGKNFSCPHVGVSLMMYMVVTMYENFLNAEEINWREDQILAKLFELQNLLSTYESDNDERRDNQEN